MGVFLKNIGDIRTIDWGDDLLWDVQFPEGPEPFRNWFPATSINENKYTLELKTFSLFKNTYSIPEATAEFDLQMTFIDDIQRSILEWISDWVNVEILNNGDSITPVKHAAKQVFVVRTNHQGEEIKRTNYWVIPRGSGYFKGESQSNAAAGEVEFVIVGKETPTS